MDKARKERQKAVDNSVKMIALARKVCEMADEDVDEFDKELNEMCDRWHKKFAEMNAQDVALFMITDLIDTTLDIERVEE